MKMGICFVMWLFGFYMLETSNSTASLIVADAYCFVLMMAIFKEVKGKNDE